MVHKIKRSDDSSSGHLGRRIQLEGGRSIAKKKRIRKRERESASVFFLSHDEIRHLDNLGEMFTVVLPRKFIDGNPTFWDTRCLLRVLQTENARLPNTPCRNLAGLRRSRKSSSSSSSSYQKSAMVQLDSPSFCPPESAASRKGSEAK